MLTRADLRESARKALGLRTPFDAGVTAAKKGDLPPWQPHPSNGDLDSALEQVVADLNTRLYLWTEGAVGALHTASKDTAAQSADGPLVVELSDAWDGLPGEGLIQQVRRVWWSDGTTNYALDPVHREELDRGEDEYLDEAPTTPREWWAEGFRLFIRPAPSTAGTLFVIAGTGLLAPADDAQGVSGLPYHFEVRLGVLVARQAARANPYHPVFAPRLPYLEAEGALIEQAFAAWRGWVSGPAQRSLVVASHRR